jgi:biopolymer transport protein TolQ
MTVLALLASGTAALPTRLDPVRLFLDADIVVQVVMGGLLLASVAVWTVTVAAWWRLGNAERRCKTYETGFWAAKDVDAFQAEQRKKDIPSSRVAQAGISEWRRSTGGKAIDRDGTRARLMAAMDGAVAEEAERMAGRLNLLATVGSVAPFVGLFGTVWGIMDSFFRIGQQQNSSLAVVAPGIAEALFATAIGLFAAIPAVIAYNRLSHRVNRFESRLFRFADRFHATLSREMET